MSDSPRSDPPDGGVTATISGGHDDPQTTIERASDDMTREHATSNGQHHSSDQPLSPSTVAETPALNGRVRERVTVPAPAGQRRRRPGKPTTEQPTIEPEPPSQPDEPPASPPQSQALPGQRARRLDATLTPRKPRLPVTYGFPRDDAPDRWAAAGFVPSNGSVATPTATEVAERELPSTAAANGLESPTLATAEPGVGLAPLDGEQSGEDTHVLQPTAGITVETVVANFAPPDASDSATVGAGQEVASHAKGDASSVNAVVDAPPQTVDVPWTPPAAYTYIEPQSSSLSLVESPPANLAPAVTAPPAVPPAGTAVGAPAPVPSEGDEEEDGGSMTIIEHLEELRRRLIWVVVAISIGAFAGWFLTVPAIQLIEAPLIKAGIHLISLSVFGGFMLQIKMAFVLGTCLAMPMILYQVWGFVAPGLTRREKRYARPFVALGSLLFLAGAATGFFIFPLGIAFALQFFPNLGILPTPEADKYVTFVGVIMVLFGLTFELPVFNVFLALIGVISSRALAQRRKAAFLVIFALAMVITPGADLVSPIILGVILCTLYESSIWLSKFVGR